MGSAARTRMESWSPRENIDAAVEAIARAVARVRHAAVASDKVPASPTDSAPQLRAQTLRMKLLLYSHSFTPNVGGVETIALSLARGLAELRTVDNRQRFALTVVTQIPSADFDDTALSFPVVRRPGALVLWRLIGEADVVHLAGPHCCPSFLLGSRRSRLPWNITATRPSALTACCFISRTDRSAPAIFRLGATRNACAARPRKCRGSEV